VLSLLVTPVRVRRYRAVLLHSATALYNDSTVRAPRCGYEQAEGVKAPTPRPW